MKILLTGATGFIGSHLKEYLEDLGYPIETLNREDWLDKKAQYRKIGNCDVVVHCAWPREKDLHSLEHVRFAVQTIEFYEMCKELGRRVINLGSSSEYGVKYKPMREDMRCEPINTYGLAKLMVTLHAKKLGFNTLRLFTVSGKGGHDFWSIIRENKIDKYSQTNNKRDYIGVGFVCIAIERMLHALHLYGEIINVASGIQVDNSAIVRVETEGKDLEELKNEGVPRWTFQKANARGFYKYPQRQYEPSVWIADVTKMKKLLNL